MASGRKRSVIQKRITLFMFFSTCAIIICGILMGLFWGNRLLRNVLVEENQTAANLISGAISRVINAEAEKITVYAENAILLEAIDAENRTYEGMNPEEIAARLAALDAQWTDPRKPDSYFKRYLDNSLSMRFRQIAQDDSRIAEIFATDKYGGLLGSSEKTSDFYQADEAWWQEAFNNGRGRVYISPVEFDESSGKYSLVIAVPIIGKDKEAAGVCKAVMEIAELFAVLRDFKIGKSGRAVMTDNENNIVYSEGSEQPGEKYLDDTQAFNKLVSGKNGWYRGKVAYTRGIDRLAVCSPVRSDLLLENNLSFCIFVDRESSEVFSLFHRLLFNLSVTCLLLMLITLPVAYFFGGVFTKPIRELHLATERILSGDWDYKINVRAHDEIGEFASRFREMLLQLRDRQEKLVRARVELEELYVNLEKRVDERTQELTRAQEATLNILEDLTEVKNRLEDALKIKSDFTSMVSHELRTPLTAIREGIALVLDGTTGQINKEQKEFLEIAKNNVDRLGNLINSILDFQKLESGKMVFNIKEDSINEVVKEAHQIMLNMAGAKGLDLSLQLSDDLPRIKFDRDKIIQVITNLVSNAIKFTDKGGVTIITSNEENGVRVSVKDTGAGIGKEDIPKLFQQFVQLQVEGPKQRKTGSSGLGLAICKQIIEAHKGKIWVESSPGVGSIFHFMLPIVEKRGL